MSKLIALYVTLSLALSSAYNAMPGKSWEICRTSQRSCYCFR